CNRSATPERYSLSLHDALPISEANRALGPLGPDDLGEHLVGDCLPRGWVAEERGDIDQDRVEEVTELLGVDLQVVQVMGVARDRSEEHTSELQSLAYLVCRLLL